MVSFQDRNEKIRQSKLQINTQKLHVAGTYDNDDHGWIPLPDFSYETVREEKSGLCTGMDAISRTFESYLDGHPAYVHPYSAVAGAWAGAINFPDPWRPEHRLDEAEAVFQEYNVISRAHYAMNHCAPDMNIGLSLGFAGLLSKIRKYRTLNNPTDPDVFYNGEERLVLAVQRFVKRHADAARDMAAAAKDAFERKNLLAIADMNDYLVEGPPRSLREAVQFLAWFQTIDRMYYLGGALQELDELLRPFFEADLAAGRLPAGEQGEEEVVWYLVSLLFNDTHYSQIGGASPSDGHDLCSRMSFLILEAMHRLRIPANVALRVHEHTNEQLFDKCIEYLLQDGTGVSYSLSGGLDAGFVRNGFPLPLARMRAKVGCNWTALPGIEYPLQDVTRVCLAKPMLLAFADMMKAGERSMQALFARYEQRLAFVVDWIKRGVDHHIRYKHLERPEIVYNLFAHGPIERGVDMSHGGVDIYDIAADATSLATVADSLAALEQRVEKEGMFTWEEVAQALAINWKGFELMRLALMDVPRFGSGGSPADEWALRVSRLYARLLRDTPTPDGHIVLPGIFSHGSVYHIGKALPATPNGRFDGDPISHSADPDPGFLKGGGTAPTAKANAVALVQCGWGNSTPLQMDIDASLASEMGGHQIVKALIQAHNDMGGTLVNINVISKEKILEAHKDPDKYPDLVVRVTGYSAFFRSLSAEYRRQVVERWLSR